MQQRLEIRCFLFVAHSQFAEIVHPGMRSLHDPTARSAFGFVASRPGQSLRGHMRDIAPLPYLSLGGSARVAFINAEILRMACRRLGSGNHDRVQRLRQQFDVMSIGAGNDKRERGATAVHQQTALGPFFSPGLWGCCPPPPAPEALYPGCRPNFATPRQCPPSRRTRPSPRATTAQRTRPAATAESNGGSHWRCRRLWATPSIDNRCAAHTRWPRKSLAAPSACARRRAGADMGVGARPGDSAGAATVRLVTTVHPRLPKIALSPCRNTGTGFKTCQLLFTDKLLI
jgi:hypothetical protein